MQRVLQRGGGSGGHFSLSLFARSRARVAGRREVSDSGGGGGCCGGGGAGRGCFIV